MAHPLNAGSDRLWAATTLAVALAAIAAGRFRGVSGMRVAAGIELALAAFIAIASGRLVSVIGVAFFLAVAFAAGKATMRFARLEGDDLEGDVLALAAGLALSGGLFLALAALHLLYPSILRAAALAVAYAGRRDLLALWRRIAALHDRPTAPPSLATRAAVCLGGYVAILGLTWAVAPEVQFDALSYHLVAPRDYLAAHGLVRPFATPSYLAHLAEAVYGAARAIAGEAAPKLVALSVGVVTALAGCAIARRLAGSEAGIWSALLLISTPLYFWLAATAYADLFMAMFLAAAYLAVLRADDRRRGEGIVFAAGLGGAAVGTKFTAAFAAPVLAAAAIFALARMRKTVWIWAAGAAALLVALPWYAVNYGYAGNPIYPIPTRFFPGKGESDALNAYLLFGLGRSWSSALSAISALTFQTARFGEGLPNGALGAAPLLVPLLIVAIFVRRGRTRVAAGLAATYLAAWWTWFQYGRYLVSIFPILVPSALSLLPWRPGRARRLARCALFVTLVAQTIVVPVRFWNLRERFPVRFAFGLESRDELLTRALPPYSALQWLNARIAPDEKVLTSGISAMRYYSRAPLGTTEDTPDLKMIFLPSRRNAAAAQLIARGYRWMVVPATHPESRPLLEAFLRKHGTLRFEKNGCAVYRIGPETGLPRF